MPKVKDSEGNVIAELPYTDEGMEHAEDMKEAFISLIILSYSLNLSFMKYCLRLIFSGV